jgi:hypothetical protein
MTCKYIVTSDGDEPEEILTFSAEGTLLTFHRTLEDGTIVHSHFDFKDGKWQFWGDVSVDESARFLFESLGEIIDEYLRRKNDTTINTVFKSVHKSRS